MTDSDVNNCNEDHTTNTSRSLTEERSIGIYFNDICGTDITINMDHSKFSDTSIRYEKILDCRLMLNTTSNNDLPKNKKRKIEDISLSKPEYIDSAKKQKDNTDISSTLCLPPSPSILVGFTTTPESEEIFVPCVKIGNI